MEGTSGNEEAIADRVAEHQAAFANSMFTVEGWHAIAAGPSFRPEFDLLARAAAAAITVWLLGEGKCGMIEPMDTHPDHRRLGHGQRTIRAACAALARVGACGVCVVTPESNARAAAAYRAGVCAALVSCHSWCGRHRLPSATSFRLDAAGPAA